jgi:Fe-S cluster assembly protein SufD
MLETYLENQTLLPELPDFSAYQLLCINGHFQTHLLHLLPYFVIKNEKDGITIEIEKNAIINKPLHILYINSDESIQTRMHNHIIAHENAQLVLIEHFMTFSKDIIKHSTDVTNKIVIKNNAQVTYYKIIDDNHAATHTGITVVEQNKDSQFKAQSFTLNGRLIRNQLDIHFMDAHAECELNGLYTTHSKQHVTQHVRVDHFKPHCISRQNYKGIVNDYSHAVFNSQVFVHPNAHKSNASQSNKNLLLTTTAKVDTYPQLEIFNDDVKCTHGATLGQIDESALFYLCSRGLNKELATRLLIAAFAEEIIAKVNHEPLKKYLLARIKYYE